MKNINPSFQVYGLDISRYAIEHSMDDIRPNCIEGCASKLPYSDNEFDLVISINTLHNLNLNKLWPALAEMNRYKTVNICVLRHTAMKRKRLTCFIGNLPAAHFSVRGLEIY